MSGVIGISNGDFVTTPEVIGQGGSWSQQLTANGVTDAGLFDAGASVGMPLDWLDTLTPAQLQEKTIGNFEEGPRDTTYGDLKLYRQLQTDLGDQISLLSQQGSNVGLQALTASKADGADVQALQVTNLFTALKDDKPGCITAAESYLTSLSEGGSGNLPSVSAQTAIGRYEKEEAYRLSNPHGNWANAASARGAYAALTLLESANALDAKA